MSQAGGRWRRILKRFHPEGIPWPASVFYNALSGTGIFLRHYDLVARDIARYGTTRHLLDIGTGPGHLLLAVHRRFPDARLVGVDISPAMAAQAQRNVKRRGADDRIQIRVAGADALPFADAAFDCVVSTGSLHHWRNPVDALAEAHRVLAGGGYALMYDLVRNMPRSICQDVRNRFGGFRLGLLWLHSFEEPFLSAEEMTALGRRTDFTVEGTAFAGALCCLVLRKTAAVESGRYKKRRP
ncbi:MAG: class I SAM-dependent methyltransferase [Desulfobacteraceae bacterium]|nr:class I SAM-dependent methyltransferase [Desulfobacteraceae bacterium]